MAENGEPVASAEASLPESLDFNPFGENVAGQYFVGREEQINLFKSSLVGLRKGVPRHFYVAGLQGTGKTSYLAKLVDIAKHEGFVAVRPTIDATASQKQHIETIVQAIIEGVEEKQTPEPRSGVGALRQNWDRGGESTLFRLPRSQILTSDDLKYDLKLLLKEASNAAASGIVVCIDEAQRTNPHALSALKNALQDVQGYLIILSLRLEKGDTADAVDLGRQILEDKAKEAEGDLGLSRLYVTGKALGAFSSDDESRRCIVRRLAGNRISFDEQVVREIGVITGRIPSAIIALCSALYDATAAAGEDKRVADFEMLKVSFRSLHQKSYSTAAEVVDSSSNGARTWLRTLLRIGRAADVTEIVRVAYPTVPAEARESMLAGAERELKRLAKTAVCCGKDDKFDIVDSYARYALNIALEST